LGAYPYVSDLIFALTGLDIPIKIATFGFCLASALLFAIFVLGKELARRQALGYFQEVKVLDKKGAKSETSSKKNKKEKADEYRVVPPKEIATNIGVISGLFGIVGARLFHILEYPERFIQDPIGMLFARSGLTVIGGLIVGCIATSFYLKKIKISFRTALDAASPAMMLGYAIGRIGCQLSGDGDWGIVADMSLKPDWWPSLLWAQTYVGNVVGADIAAPGVYPTPIYETSVCLALFFLLWKLRHKMFAPGWLFSWYLVLSGIERFFIEQIRVNTTYDWGFLQPTQAEILSVIMLFGGIYGLWKTWKPYSPPFATETK
jgi:phosphatidylglycerol---prolipoprotein diacylglyceryl transferase